METLFQHAEITVAMVLAFVRFGAFFVVAPFPGVRAPAVARIFLAGGVAWAFSARLGAVESTGLGMAIAGEVVLGLAMGFLLQLVVHAFSFGGEAAGTQMNLADPSFLTPMQTRVTVLGSAYTMTALGVYAVGDGPHLLFTFLARYLEVVPPGVFSPEFDGRAITMEVGSELFSLGLRAGAPVIAAVFAAQLVLGIVSRAVPHLNMLIEGPGFTITTGVVGLLASVQTFSPLVDEAFHDRLEDLARWFVI
ncbi:MAG: flagellar biosynthetic protein FliR [Deltaproteobacteria bacterium]|jgi:flagellar biosynthetic protein FliR